jgi:hypothetical protein
MRGPVIQHPAAGGIDSGWQPSAATSRISVACNAPSASIVTEQPSMRGEVGVGAAEQVERMKAAGGCALQPGRIEQFHRRGAAAVHERLAARAGRIEPQCGGGGASWSSGTVRKIRSAASTTCCGVSTARQPSMRAASSAAEAAVRLATAATGAGRRETHRDAARDGRRR